MKFRKLAICAIVCCVCAFSGCSDKDKSSSEASSQLESSAVTSASTVTSIVTVTDDEGKDVTDNKGQAVTSVVTIVDTNDDENDTTTAPFITSVSETVVTQNVTVTDTQGEAVTDAQGNAETEVITSVSQVVVTVRATTTQKTTTTAKSVTTTKTTVGTSVAATTTSNNSGSLTTTTATSPAVTSVPTTTTSSSAQTENDVILSFSDIDYPTAGECIGSVSIPVVNIEMDLYFGDTNQILRKGIGLYYGSYLPGYEGRSIMCGHNSDGYLADWVNYAKANDVVGERIIVNTTYGDYVYEIYETAILDSSDTRYFTNSYSTSTLILYSCMESDYTNERIYFVAKKLSGPVLVQ